MKSFGLFSLLVLPLVVPAISLSAMFAQNLSSITLAQIEAVAPKSKSCSDADLPDECATSKQAAPAIAHSFMIYKVASRAEQAAVIGLMAFESAEFQYSRNQYHGVPGQGSTLTLKPCSLVVDMYPRLIGIWYLAHNMQSPTFNLKYAQSIPALKDQVASVRGDPVQVLDLLLTKMEYDFGSGAWFLTM